MNLPDLFDFESRILRIDKNGGSFSKISSAGILVKIGLINLAYIVIDVACLQR